MKIVQVAQCFPPALGGVETHVFRISKELVDNGNEVVVYCTNLASSKGEKVLPAKYWNHEIEGIQVRRFPALRLVRSVGVTIMPSMLGGLLKEDNVNIIHAHSYGYSPIYCSYLPSKLKHAPTFLHHTSLLRPLFL